MATYTTNYNLAKPEGTDTADISVINGNMDTIDTQLATLAAAGFGESELFQLVRNARWL